MEETKLPEQTGSTNDATTQNVVENQPAQTDYLSELKAKDDKIAKLQSERDNYRKMGLKYKKESQNTEEISTDEERIRQIAQETAQEVILASSLAQASAEKEELIKRMAKENNELRTAIQNKAQMSNMPGGFSQPNDKITVDKITPEQRADLIAQAKAINVDPDKFVAKAIENLSKIK